MTNPRRARWRSLPLCLGTSFALHAGLFAAAAYLAVGLAGGSGGGGEDGTGSSSFTIRVRARGTESERVEAKSTPVVPPAAEPVATPVPEPTPTTAPEIALPPPPPAESTDAVADTHENPSSGSGGGAGGGDGSGTGAHEGDGADGKGPAVRSTPAKLASDPRPDYPPESVRRGEEGSVLCAMRVDEEGHVADVEILRSSGHPALDRAAVEALRRWIFEPAREDGKPAAARVLHQVVFRLD
jgi:TonB family protein